MIVGQPGIVGRSLLIGAIWGTLLAISSAQSTSRFTPQYQVNVPQNFFCSGGFEISSANVVGTAHAEILSRDGSCIGVVDTHATGGTAITTIAFAAFVNSFATSDIDQDGDTDLAASLSGGNVVTARNMGGGSFTITTLPTPPTVIAPVHFGDLDGDGFSDIVSGHRIWINDGSGAFPTAGTLASIGTTSPIDVMPGDFDGDGDVDLVSVFHTSGAPGPGIVRRILRNNANGGTFTLLTSGLLESTIGTNAYPFVADMNGDGLDDLLLACAGPSLFPSQTSRRYRTHLGQSPLGFSALSPTDIEEGDVTSPVLADWNGDGLPDLAISVRALFGGNLGFPYTYATVVGILMNDGTGALSPSGGRGVENLSFYSGGTTGTIFPITLGAVDDDSDGAPDLVIKSQLPVLSIFRNETATSSPLSTVITNPSSSVATVRSYGTESLVDLELDIDSPVYVGEAAAHFVHADFPDPNGVIVRHTRMTSVYGLAKIRVPDGYPSSTFPMTISTPEGVLGTFDVLLSANVTITGGTGQTAFPYQTWSSPITGTVTTLGGSLVAGVRVSLEQVSGPSITYLPITVGTDANGQFSFTVNGATAGVYQLRCRVSPTIVSAPFTMTIVGTTTNATIVQGSPQITCPGAAITPVVVQVVPSPGQPLAGYLVTLNPATSGASPVAFTSTQAWTDAFGNATFTGVGSAPTGSMNYNVRIFNLLTSAVVTMTAQPPSAQVVAGGNQSIDLGQATPSPITFEFRDCLGAPIVGAVVAISTPTGGVLVPSASAVTDTAGQVTVSPTVTAAGLQRVRATLGFATAESTIFVRGLAIATIPGLLMINYHHDHAGVPLLLAVDVPPSAPYLTTPYGEIWTSVLAPQPTLAVLDGFGIFGSIDPDMTTVGTGVWSRIFVLPAISLNLTFIAQMYGYDAQNLFPDDYIVSQPVLFGL